MLLAVLLLGTTHARAEDGVVTGTTLELWRQELTGPIEAAAGRRFAERPRLKIVSAVALKERLARVRKYTNPTGPAQPPRRGGYVMGLYVPETQEIFLTPQHWRALFISWRLDDALLEPIAKCVVAHEMVHALEHQYGGIGSNPVSAALAEGFADHVAGQVCGPGQRWLDLVQGLDVPASQPPEDATAFDYGYAESFVRVLEETAGIEAVWNALGSAPVTREMVARVGSAGMPAGWTDARVLAPVAATLGAEEGWRVDARAVSPTAALAPLSGEQGGMKEIPALGGLQWYAVVGDHQVNALAFLVRDADDAVAWLRERRAAIARQEVWTLFRTAFTYDRVGLRRVPELARLPGVTDTFALRIEVAGDWSYHEQWIVRGRHLLGAAVFDARPDPARLTQALTALAALDLPDVPETDALSEADSAALRALAPAAPLSRTVFWGYRYAQQYPALLSGDWPRCLAGVEAALPEFDGQARAALAHAGMYCAVKAADLPAAERLVAAGALTADPDGARTADHAGMLADAGRWEEAHAAATRALAHDAQHAHHAADIVLRATVALARWPDAERLVATSGASVDARVAAALALVGAGRGGAARRALATACPTFTADERARCDAALATLPR